MKKQILLSVAIIAASSTEVFAERTVKASRSAAPVVDKPINQITKPVADASVTTLSQLQAAVAANKYPAADVAAGAAIVANSMGGNANSVGSLTAQAVLNA
jgi:hypothetical protein